MKLEVLAAVMNQTDHSILNKMNLSTDAIVINQCDKHSFESVSFKDKLVKFISFNERGVGLSRNNALIRSDADICLMADDDVIYVDDYEKIVLNEFKNHPNADVILFNFESLTPGHKIAQTKKFHRIRWYNCMKYGTIRIAFRRKEIYKKRITFSLLFGGGAKYSAGEDTLFIFDCINKGLKVYASPKKIGNVSYEKSSWFSGYNEKFFFDEGALFASLFKRTYFLFCLQYLFRHKHVYKKLGFKKSLKSMLNGAKEFNSKK